MHIPIPYHTQVQFRQLSVSDGISCGISLIGSHLRCWGTRIEEQNRKKRALETPNHIPMYVQGPFRQVKMCFIFICNILYVIFYICISFLSMLILYHPCWYFEIEILPMTVLLLYSYCILFSYYILLLYHGSNPHTHTYPQYPNTCPCTCTRAGVGGRGGAVRDRRGLLGGQ